MKIVVWGTNGVWGSGFGVWSSGFGGARRYQLVGLLTPVTPGLLNFCALCLWGEFSSGDASFWLMLLAPLAWPSGIAKNRSQKRTQDSHSAFGQKKSLNSKGEIVGERSGGDTYGGWK